MGFNNSIEYITLVNSDINIKCNYWIIFLNIFLGLCELLIFNNDSVFLKKKYTISFFFEMEVY